MVQRILLTILLCSLSLKLSARELYSSYISSGFHYGSILDTNEFIGGDKAIHGYTTETLKYTMRLNNDMWQKQEYGDPYYGVGISFNQFGRKNDLGNPIALYLLQGATICPISKRVDFNYELNLGVSTGWKPYDSESNPDNMVISTKTSINIVVAMYFKWQLSQRLNLNLGASLFHASNGSFQQPNKGMNGANIYAEMAYNFNRPELEVLTLDEAPEVPRFKPHFEHSIDLIFSSKNIKGVDDKNESIYNYDRYPIFGADYKFMRAPNHKFRYGVGCEVLYDKSAGASLQREFNEIDEIETCTTDYAPISDRFSMGLSVEGELVKPYFTTFANVGYVILQGEGSDVGLYQTVGIRVGIYDELCGSFGVRAKNFGKAMFLYLSLGYTFGA